MENTDFPSGAASGPAAGLDEKAFEEGDSVLVASQWQLMWWRFRKHKLAMGASVVVILLYIIGFGCEFFAIYDPSEYNARYLFAPPSRIHFVNADGSFSLRPHIHGLRVDRDRVTLRWLYSEDVSQVHFIRFFVHGAPYRFLGFWQADVHLLGVEDPRAPFFLFGTDSMGRDLYSRIVYGTRISMSIGLVGVALSLTLGIILGGLSGFYGGVVDLAIQRVIEFLRSIPTIPLWMSLAAAMPPGLPPLRVYFYITVILSMIGWTGMARVVRGRFLALRSEDFVMAARICGSSEIRIILRHMVPSFISHIIASVSLSIPAMILSETSLSFLGLGLRPPTISWGVLLQDAQNVRSVALATWLLLPGLAVVIAVLAFNFFGDGVRDAADPYSR